MLKQLRLYLKRPGLGPMLVRATEGCTGVRIAGMFFGFLVGVQLARGLGVEGYGTYGLAMSVVASLQLRYCSSRELFAPSAMLAIATPIFPHSAATPFKSALWTIGWQRKMSAGLP